MTPRELAERVRELREAKGLSPAALAERANIAPSYVLVIEAGHHRMPPRSILLRIARALGVTEERLLELH